MSSKKKRSQGGGRKANSEPRVQVFKEFGGCNFELSPRDFTLGKLVDQEQSDLALNYFVIQNNACVTSNKTIETRYPLYILTHAPNNTYFTKASILIGNKLYVGLSNGELAVTSLGIDTTLGYVRINNRSDISEHHWESFAFIDNKLVGTTRENQLWTGDIDSGSIENVAKIPNPSPLVMNDLHVKGDLNISSSLDNNHPYRIALAYTLVNKYGPTAHSNQLTFYANYPLDEWNTNRYLEVLIDTQANCDAVELYYAVGNSSSLLFAGRTDYYVDNYSYDSGTGTWSSYNTFFFNWYGYLDTTNMWAVANLIAPTENYTEGPKASHVTCIDGRLYFWGNTNNPQRLYIGGNPGNLFSVSPGTGGGFVDVEPGSGQEIRVVTKYKTQSGASIVTMLCDSENSQKEQRFNLVENTVSLSNEQSMKSWQAEQVAGAVGCKSFNGAIVCEDGLYAVSRYGLALTTMTMEYNSQIRVNYVSDPIKPIFTDVNRQVFKSSCLIECDGVLYLAVGKNDGTLENIVFCYDIEQKAWWTISVDTNGAILNMFHVDYEGFVEGIGFITENTILLLPTTKPNEQDIITTFPVTLQTGELAVSQPQQNWIYLSQLEFRFDWFRGSVLVELTGIDQFGRKVSTNKRIRHLGETKYNLAEYMRVDLRLQSYQIRITGTARFRLTHFMAKVYTMSAKQGLVWGFDDSQSFRSNGDIHPTFLDYNDIKKAIIP